jgi:hypothetical protein
VSVQGSVDCTGYMDYVVEVTNTGQAALPAFSANLSLAMSAANAVMAMGLDGSGGYIEEFVGKGSDKSHTEWVVLDYGAPVTADGMALYSVGDGVHDPADIILWAGVTNATAARAGGSEEQLVHQHDDSAGGRLRGHGGGAPLAWQLVGAFRGKPGSAAQQPFAFGKTASRLWKLEVLGRTKSQKCTPAASCQGWYGEVQLRDAASGKWILNKGTVEDSIVVASSGDANGVNNAAWKLADGTLGFIQDSQGWDAGSQNAQPTPAPTPGPPGPPTPAPPNATASKVWKWDGKNGNSAVWVGSSAAGLRMFLKGEEDLWQAAVPFDSQDTPPNPTSWSNAGAGGIEVFLNGTAVAFTAPRALAAGAALRFRFSIMATPVRPLDLPKHWGERYAQLGGPANYR